MVTQLSWHPRVTPWQLGSHVKIPLLSWVSLLVCSSLKFTDSLTDWPWRQHNKHADWVWRQQRGKQGLVMIDGYRFLEENRLTEHASVWQRSALHSPEENSFTLDQSCLLHFFHVPLNILLHSLGRCRDTWKTRRCAQNHATYATKSPCEKQSSCLQ